MILFGVLFIVSCSNNNTESKNFDVEKFDVKHKNIDIQSLIQNVKDSADVDTNFFITEDIMSFTAIYHQGDSIFSLYVDDTRITQEFRHFARDHSYTAREDDMDRFVPFPFWDVFMRE